jgi:tetratricopeptide (TPR) repeat protein
MAWETALDRLVLQLVHQAEKGETKPEQVRQVVLDLWQIGGPRPASAFQLGYAKVLLGVDFGDVQPDGKLRRWHLFGRLRAHDRRGERNWIADLLQDPQTLVELLAEPTLAAQVLPLAVRTLFWCGDLKLALRAIEYLAAETSAPELAMVVDAAITDLLTRLETREEAEDEESTASILHKVLAVAGFDRLPPDVRARYHKALGERLLATSEWATALQQAELATDLASGTPRLRSAAATVAALAQLRVHSIESLQPQIDRPERARALALLHHVEEDPEQASPAAVFVRSLLAYETGEYGIASRGFEKAIAGLRRLDGRDLPLLDRARFFQAAALLAEGRPEEHSRALKLMEKALDTVRPDLESFYAVHEALKKLDRRLALRFLDNVDIGRGSSPDQLLFVALEFLSLGEATQALAAASRVLDVAVDLDQRLEAMRAILTAHNMKGEREQSRTTFAEMRELLLQRGAFDQLERLLKNEAFVGQALDHVEIKVELASLYEEMEGRDFERAQLQVAIARSLRARRDVEALRQAHGLLQEVSCHSPELAKDDLQAIDKVH